MPRLLKALLAGCAVGASGFVAGGARLRSPVAAMSSAADDFDAINPSAAIAEIKADMKAAQERGDTDTVVTLMGTLLAMEGGYDNEVGAPASSGEGRCAD